MNLTLNIIKCTFRFSLVTTPNRILRLRKFFFTEQFSTVKEESLMKFNVNKTQKPIKKSWIHWFGTSNGRNGVCLFFLTFGLGGITMLTTYPNTWGKDSMVNFYFYHPDQSSPLEKTSTYKILPKPSWSSSESMKTILANVISDMKLSKLEAESVELFPADTLEPVSYGNVQTVWGGVIGYPRFIDTYDNLSFNTGYSLLYGDRVEFSDSTKMKNDLFILSPKALRFMLAERLSQLMSFDFYFSSLCLPMASVACYATSHRMNTNLNFFKKTIYHRLFLYTVLTAGYFLLVNLMSAWFSYFRDAKVDEIVCGLGKDYAEGGVEYFEQMVERAAFCRNNLNYGDYHILPQGLVAPYWFQPPMFKDSTPAERAKRCKELLKCLYGSNDK